MLHQSNATLDLSAAEYDFSLESPRFRQSLLARFLSAARGYAPLRDDELEMLNAAGRDIPEKPVKRNND